MGLAYDAETKPKHVEGVASNKRLVTRDEPHAVTKRVCIKFGTWARRVRGTPSLRQTDPLFAVPNGDLRVGSASSSHRHAKQNGRATSTDGFKAPSLRERLRHPVSEFNARRRGRQRRRRARANVDATSWGYQLGVGNLARQGNRVVLGKISTLQGTPPLCGLAATTGGGVKTDQAN